MKAEPTNPTGSFFLLLVGIIYSFGLDPEILHAPPQGQKRVEALDFVFDWLSLLVWLFVVWNCFYYYLFTDKTSEHKTGQRERVMNMGGGEDGESNDLRFWGKAGSATTAQYMRRLRSRLSSPSLVSLSLSTTSHGSGDSRGRVDAC